MKILVFSKSNAFSNSMLNLGLSLGVLKLNKTNKENPQEIYDVFIDNTLAQTVKAIEVENFLYLTNKDIERIELESKEQCEFIIISTHKSETQKTDTISIHYCGNFNKNKLGGEEHNFSIAYLSAFEFFYNKLSKDNNKPKDLIFFVEATHHGPTINRKVIYYEIGPNDKAYNNKDYQNYYLQTLLEYLKQDYKTKNCAYILIGAPHYLNKPLIDSIKNKMKQKYNTNEFILSHIMPKYSLSELVKQEDNKIEEVLTKLIDCSETGKIILNKEYMKSLAKISSILEKIKKKEILTIL